MNDANMESVREKIAVLQQGLEELSAAVEGETPVEEEQMLPEEEGAEEEGSAMGINVLDNFHRAKPERKFG